MNNNNNNDYKEQNETERNGMEWNETIKAMTTTKTTTTAAVAADTQPKWTLERESKWYPWGHATYHY